MKIIYINGIHKDEISGQASFENNIMNYLSKNKDIIFFSVDNNMTYKDKNSYYIKLNKNSKISYITYQLKLFFYLFKVLFNFKRKKEKTIIYYRLSPYNITPFIIKKLFKTKMIIRSGPMLQNLLLRRRLNKFIIKLFYYLLTNYTNLYSYNKLSKLFQINDKTIKEYIKYFNEAYIFFEIEKFDYSLKKQQINEKTKEITEFIKENTNNNISIDKMESYEKKDLNFLRERFLQLKEKINVVVNLKSIEEYKEYKEKYDEIKEKLKILEDEKTQLEEDLEKINLEKTKIFMDYFTKLKSNLQRIGKEFGLGIIDLKLTSKNLDESGLKIILNHFHLNF